MTRRVLLGLLAVAYALVTGGALVVVAAPQALAQASPLARWTTSGA